MTGRDVLGGARLPIVAAPMAGGASTPELVVEVGRAGGLGYLAGGYLRADALAERIAAVRAAGPLPFGVNVFVPQAQRPDPAELAAYRDRLAAEAARAGVALGEPPEHDDDDWAAKVELLEREAPPVVSFAFGCPPPEVTRRLRAAGSAVVVTVTTPDEALAAVAAGADGLCVQGAEAGAHQGGFTPTREPRPTGLLPLLAVVRHALAAHGHADLPVIAAGGLADGRAVAAVLAAGARAAQLGTAFLRAPESGTSATHKDALADPAFDGTELTLAFTGRPARGLRNRFLVEHRDAPVGYPQIHHLTRPLRAAAASAGDPQTLHLWAGEGYRLAQAAPAGQITAELWREARLAGAEAARLLR